MTAPRDMAQRASAALAFLNDPHRFAAEMVEFTFSNTHLDLDAVFNPETNSRAWALRTNALDALRQALQCPGIDPQDVGGLMDDATGHVMFEMMDLGIHQGVALERIRHALLDCYAAMEDEKGRSTRTSRTDEQQVSALADKVAAVRSALGKVA